MGNLCSRHKENDLTVYYRLINLIILFVAEWESGDTQRRVVREQLQDEPDSVIRPEENAGVDSERRLHLRMVPGYAKKTAKAIRDRQNELAFRKEFVQQYGGELDNDPPVEALRQLIAAEHAKTTRNGKGALVK